LARLLLCENPEGDAVQSFRELSNGTLALPDAGLLFAIGVAVLGIVAAGVVRWARRPQGEGRVRVTVYCPLHHATARVLCRRGVDGRPSVDHRDLLTRRGLRACDAGCLHGLVEQPASPA
jgi:hypothetical protein